MSAHENSPKVPDPDATFDRAKRPMILAAVGVTSGLAIAGSVERNVGGVLLLCAWLVGILALHHLGRSGSNRPQASDLTPRGGEDARS